MESVKHLVGAKWWALNGKRVEIIASLGASAYGVACMRCHGCGSIIEDSGAPICFNGWSVYCTEACVENGDAAHAFECNVRKIITGLKAPTVRV